MLGLVTPEKAQTDLTCPLARTFGDENLQANCRGARCAVWRWTPLPAKDPRFVQAISNEMERLHAKHKEEHPLSDRKPQGFHKEAVANVNADLAAHDLPTGPERGFCGLGGEPKA